MLRAAMLLMLGGLATPALAQPMAMPMRPAGPAGAAADPAMDNLVAMNAHRGFTALQPARPGDQARADAILAQVRQVIAPYADVHRSEADGFTPLLPSLVRTHYHFSRRDNFRANQQGFDVTRQDPARIWAVDRD